MTIQPNVINDPCTLYGAWCGVIESRLRMKRRILPAVILISVAIVVFSFAGLGVYYIWQERFWPFSTGTRDKLFLDTTFGMSPQEVRRTLAHHGAQLLSREDYSKALEATPLPGAILMELTDAAPLFPETEVPPSRLFMPPIEMFDSKVVARFIFWRGRLAEVEAEIHPIFPMRPTRW
jgi:hypothetical protein